MDVAREFREVNFKIKMQIRRDALIATAKIYNMTPEAYAAKLDAEQAEATLKATRDASYNMGLMIGNLQRAWQESVEQVAAGIKAAMGR